MPYICLGCARYWWVWAEYCGWREGLIFENHFYFCTIVHICSWRVRRAASIDSSSTSPSLLSILSTASRLAHFSLRWGLLAHSLPLVAGSRLRERVVSSRRERGEKGDCLLKSFLMENKIWFTILEMVELSFHYYSLHHSKPNTSFNSKYTSFLCLRQLCQHQSSIIMSALKVQQ